MNVDFSTAEGREQFAEEARHKRLSQEQFNDIIADQLEYTRKKYGLKKRYFASILDISEQYYGKMSTHERMVTVSALINYCRLFGMDISAITNEALLNESDPVIRETAIYLASLSNDTLAKIEDVIQKSGETDTAKKRGITLLEKMLTLDQQK